jgi:hypothetical protein
MIARRACRAMVDHAVTVGSDRGNRGIIMVLADDTRPWCRLKAHAEVTVGDAETMPVR